MEPNTPESEGSYECYSTDEECFIDLCRFGDFDDIKEYVNALSEESKFDWTWTSNSNDNFIHMLAANNHTAIFEFLMDSLKRLKKESLIEQLINHQNSSGNTPLHYAVAANSKQMLEKLLEFNAETSHVHELGRTPLSEAQMLGYFELAEILAPVTKQDVEKLKQQFGALDICNQDSDEERQQQESQKKE